MRSQSEKDGIWALSFERGDALAQRLIPSPQPLATNHYKWLMRLAIEAAPKPLSMFTTDTPDAQLFSMPSRAAMPPKLAP